MLIFNWRLRNLLVLKAFESVTIHFDHNTSLYKSAENKKKKKRKKLKTAFLALNMKTLQKTLNLNIKLIFFLALQCQLHTTYIHTYQHVCEYLYTYLLEERDFISTMGPAVF